MNYCAYKVYTFLKNWKMRPKVKTLFLSWDHAEPFETAFV